MARNNLPRIKKEFQEIGKLSKSAGVKAEIVNNDYTHWKGYIRGPDDSAYQGGVFAVDINIPNEYPFEPPKMKFDTKVWHPNVSSQTGAICLDILKTEWSPALTIRTALLSLQALLSTPEPDDPQDAQVAKQYKKNKKEFEKTAKSWTTKYAKDPNVVKGEKIEKIVAMGFAKAKVQQALEKYGWNEENAVNHLLANV